MNLYEFVKELQQKPEKDKRKILVALIIISAIVVGTIWVFTLKNRLGNDSFRFSAASLDGQTSSEDKENKDASGARGPFESLAHGFSVVIGDFREKTEEFFSKTNEIIPDEQNQKPRRVYSFPSTE